MKFRPLITLVALSALAVVLVGCKTAPATNSPESTAPERVEESQDTTTSSPMADAVVEAEDTDTPEVEEAPVADEAPAANRQYVAHTDELYQSLLGSESMALFFHAPWCPTCRIMDAQILENWDDFPAGTNILKVDFDTAKDLRAKYNVASQSIIVMLDADGNVTETVAFPSTDQLIKLIQDTL